MAAFWRLAPLLFSGVPARLLRRPRGALAASGNSKDYREPVVRSWGSEAGESQLL